MMTPTLRVRAAHHEVLPERRLGVSPRERFIQYQEDLHRVHGERLDPESMLHGDQYTFATLADTLIDRIGAGVFGDLDVLATSNWTPEFDPDYTAFGPYVQNRWDLDCVSFDVVDRGSIAPALGLVVLGGYLLGDPVAAEGVLLGVEQSTVPQATGAHLISPARSSAGVIRLSRTEGPGAQILAMSGLTQDQVTESGPGGGVRQLITDWCRRAEVAEEELTVALRRDGYLHRRWGRDLRGGRWFLRPGPSGMGLFSCLSELTKDPDGHDGHVLFLDEDEESLTAVAVLLRTGGKR